ncbi:hypothetical protein [Mycolicibacterium neoaurum]|uniref:Integrase n=1 Tax=Mycolicibacterium neoaurum VKM Ac-1815D TaxID=700508 RepID=V5XJ82_MYCNE
MEPTTTGKIERWHRTLRRELLDAARPHQSLAMATPAVLFRHAPIEPIAAAPAPVHH